MSYTNSDHAVTKNKIKITYSYLSTTITGQGKGRFTIKKINLHVHRFITGTN